MLSLTASGAFVLAGCGTLCPMVCGMAIGPFDCNLGLIGGLLLPMALPRTTRATAP